MVSFLKSEIFALNEKCQLRSILRKIDTKTSFFKCYMEQKEEPKMV